MSDFVPCPRCPIVFAGMGCVLCENDQVVRAEDAAAWRLNGMVGVVSLRLTEEAALSKMQEELVLHTARAIDKFDAKGEKATGYDEEELIAALDKFSAKTSAWMQRFQQLGRHA